MKSNIATDKTYIDQGWAWIILIAFLVLNCLTKVFSVRVLVIMGCLFSTLCFVLDSQATTIELVAFNHVFNGMGIAFTYGPSVLIIGHYVVKYRGTAYALTSCGSSVGQFALSPLFTYLISEYGIKGALLLNAGIFFQCITFAMLLRPTSFFDRAPIENSESEKENSFTEETPDDINTETTLMIDTKEETECKSVQVELKANVNFETVLVNGDVKQKSTKEIDYLQDKENRDNCADQGKQINVENSEDSRNEMMDSSHGSYKVEKNGGKSILSLLKTIFASVDFKLFKRPIFLTYFFGTSIGQLASTIPLAFFPSHAEDMGLDRIEGMWFVAIAGFADLGGRILTTLIADLKCLNRPRFLGCVLIIHGIVACFIPLFNNFQIFVAYCVLYGASGGVIFAISNTILTDYIGVEKLSQGLGLMLFFNGFTGAGALLLIGFLREFFGSYNPGFVINGVSLMVCGALFCAEACIKYEKQPGR